MMTNKEKLLNGLLKGIIIAAGTGVGMLISSCFAVENNDEDEAVEEFEGEIFDYKSVDETVTEE